MHTLIIEDDEGRATVVPLIRDELTIGRMEGNAIRLTERNVSRKHARVIRQGDALFVEDLGSYTGVRVNGVRIDQRTTLCDGDQVTIGDYKLAIRTEIGAEDAEETLLAGEADRPPPAQASAAGGGLGLLSTRPG